jgi:hypothetical protein
MDRVYMQALIMCCFRKKTIKEFFGRNSRKMRQLGALAIPLSKTTLFSLTKGLLLEILEHSKS